MRETVAARDTVAVPLRAPDDWVDGVRVIVPVRDVVPTVPREMAARDGVDITVDVFVVPRGKTFVAVRAETPLVAVSVVVRAPVSRTTTLFVRDVVFVVARLRTDVPDDVCVSYVFVEREIPDVPIDCVPTELAVWVRDTVVVAPRRVAARATLSASSACATPMKNKSASVMQPEKNCLIPVILSVCVMLAKF